MEEDERESSPLRTLPLNGETQLVSSHISDHSPNRVTRLLVQTNTVFNAVTLI